MCGEVESEFELHTRRNKGGHHTHTKVSHTSTTTIDCRWLALVVVGPTKSFNASAATDRDPSLLNIISNRVNNMDDVSY